MQLDKMKYSIAQIFKTSLAFLEYRRFEARRAVVCSLSAYKEPNLPGTSSKGRTLYAFYSRCKISASEARVCAERKVSIFWVKKSWRFYLSLSLLPSFFFILVQCFWSWEFTRPHFRGKRFGELKTYGIGRKEVQVLSGRFSSPFSAQRYIFFCLFIRPPWLNRSGILFCFYFIILPHSTNYK